MTAAKDDYYWAAEMCAVIDAAARVVARGKDTFFDPANSVEFSAARMAVIDLDVAAAKLSHDYKAARPDLPWKQLARTRDKYAHHYEDIDREVVWNLLVNRLPALAKALRG
ncbi:MAG TPA: HepT-like ribonuclease domain-containing protein [Nocardioidaceae bacterium]|nr:HepT-like ribonuclease domain-containing protein [Nocardioidaceae bacterium]